MRYEPAAKSVQPSRCQTGTRALGVAIGATYPELESLSSTYGCYNYRRVSPGGAWSLHAEGRALDVGVPDEQNELGWDLACIMVADRIRYGVQRVIWDGHIWSVERIDRWNPLQVASNQHRDHVHIEQHWQGARRPGSITDEYRAWLMAHRQSKSGG